VLIQEGLEFDGDPAVVWERLSDVARIPEFWHGTKSLKIVRREAVGPGKETVNAETKFAFGGSGRVEVTTDAQTKTLLLRYLSGPFTGTQKVWVQGRRLEAEWDIEFHGFFRIASGRTAGHFKSGTAHALERLSANPGRAERQQTMLK